jgi:hypothetical protein
VQPPPDRQFVAGVAPALPAEPRRHHLRRRRRRRAGLGGRVHHDRARCTTAPTGTGQGRVAYPSSP